MFLPRTFGLVTGALVGAMPFWVTALVRTGERWPGTVALAVSLLLTGMAYRTPRPWALGVAVGAVISWACLAILAGTDWRLLPYVLLLFHTHYLGAIAVMLSVYFLVRARRSPPCELVWRRWLGCFACAATAALVACGGGSPVAPEPTTSIVALGPQVRRFTMRSPCDLPLGVLPMIDTRVTVTRAGSGWLATASTADTGDVQVRFQSAGGSNVPDTMRVAGTMKGSVVHMPELLSVPSGDARATFGDAGAVLDGFAFAAGTFNPTTAFLDGVGTGSLAVTPIATGDSCTVDSFSWSIFPPQ